MLGSAWGDPQATEQLLPLVYDELRKLAGQKLVQEKPGQTLQAIALVHEAYLTALFTSTSSRPNFMTVPSTRLGAPHEIPFTQGDPMHLLNIQSSPRGSSSASIAVADAFLRAYRRACPELTVDTLNVWEENLPDFDQEAIGAKYKGVNKEPMDQAETTVWNKIGELAGRFQQADRIVLGVPMWNFAYPYKLKQLIDLACQRRMLFTYDGTEYGPLLKTPRAFVVYARGGTYAEDSPTPASQFDHQKGYIDFWLKFIGVSEVRTLVVEGTTWGGKEKGEESIARGQEEAKKLAADF